jgi:hypothetical protein
MLGSTAKTLADGTANSAVVAAIAPICVDQFQHSADVANNLTALKKTSTWEQAAYVEKGGWATMPGSKAADSGVSQACAAILGSLLRALGATQRVTIRETVTPSASPPPQRQWNAIKRRLTLTFTGIAPANASGMFFDLSQDGVERGMRPAGHSFQSMALWTNRELMGALSLMLLIK